MELEADGMTFAFAPMPLSIALIEPHAICILAEISNVADDCC